MKLLVAGSKRVDAGKTTVAAGLVAATDAVGFKPRAGNDLWYDHDDCRRALADGRLYGKDASRLADASPGSLEPEAINPVHRLWRPSPGPGAGLLGDADREFLLDRVGDRYVVNGTVDVPNVVSESLDRTDPLVVETTEALNEVTEAQHLPAQQEMLETVWSTDRAVVESYGDVASPLPGFEPDAVAVVEPRRIRLYRGDRYRKARGVAPRGQHDGSLEQRVDRVLDLLEPAATHEIEPLPGEVRTDPAAVADAYESLFDSVVDLAADAARP
jgi:predicted P-loop ATPase/GTPase